MSVRGWHIIGGRHVSGGDTSWGWHVSAGGGHIPGGLDLGSSVVDGWQGVASMGGRFEVQVSWSLMNHGLLQYHVAPFSKAAKLIFIQTWTKCVPCVKRGSVTMNKKTFLVLLDVHFQLNDTNKFQFQKSCQKAKHDSKYKFFSFVRDTKPHPSSNLRDTFPCT